MDVKTGFTTYAETSKTKWLKMIRKVEVPFYQYSVCSQHKKASIKKALLIIKSFLSDTFWYNLQNY